MGRIDGDRLAGDDLVHPDLHAANVLVDDAGDLTGVVDWDAAGRGDARLGWVTMLFDLVRGRRSGDHHHALSAAALDGLVELIGGVPLGRLRPMWAHLSLRQVDWSLRHKTAERVGVYLDLAEDGIRRYGLG